MHTFISDLRYGARVLLKARGFSAIAVTALALGIGANLTIFGFAWPLLAAPPSGIANPGTVVRAFTNRFSGTDAARYEAYRDRNHTFSSLAAFRTDLSSVRLDGPPEQIATTAVSGEYFSTLGVAAALGRPIVVGDVRPGASPVVVLSDRFWRLRFGASPSAIGRSFTVNGRRCEIVGVTPAAFAGTMAPISPAFYMPLASRAGETASVQMIGRLRPGSSIGEAQADLTTLATQEAGPATDGTHPPTMTVYQARALVPEIAVPAAIFSGFLLALVGLVLMVACANIATLMLARSTARRREMGIRVALGASRGRLIRQLLTESLLLSCAGGAMAALVAVAAARPLTAAATGLPSPVPLVLDFAADWRLLCAVAVLSLATTMLCGLMPALQTSKRDVLPALKEGIATPGRERSRLRGVFMTAQVAMATVLLALAALLVRGLVSARTLDRGFNADGVLTASISLDTAGYAPERGGVFYDDLLDRLDRTPGIAAATLVEIVPLTLSNRANQMIADDARPTGAARQPAMIYSNRVSRGHFRTLGIAMLGGRDFSAADRADSPPVAIVNEALAARFWPNENPIGRRLRGWNGREATGAAFEVVGVVRNSKYVTVGEETRAFMYRPLSQDYMPAATIVVKSAAFAMGALPLVRAQVESLEPNLPLFGVMTLDAATSVSLLPVKIAASLAAGLGLVALALGGLGLYGVMTYLVRQRTREIGIRIALGAEPAAVVRLITGQGMRWTIAGLAVGVAVSIGIATLIAGFLYGVGPVDPIAFTTIVAILGATSFAACYVPARRASRVDPLVALRDE